MESSGITEGDQSQRRSHRVNIVAEMLAGKRKVKQTRSQKPTNSEKYGRIHDKIIRSNIKPPDRLTLGSWNNVDNNGLRDEILLEPSGDIEELPVSYTHLTLPTICSV